MHPDQAADCCRKEKKRKEKKRKENKTKENAFRRRFNEKPSIIPCRLLHVREHT